MAGFRKDGAVRHLSWVALVFAFGVAACDASRTIASVDGSAVAEGVRLGIEQQQSPDWLPAVNLGRPVNTAAVELAPFISSDGLSLYFGSTRKGTLGGIDIWVSHRASVHHPWQEPVHLPAPINSGCEGSNVPTSACNDNGAALSADGSLLFFNSNRAGGFGRQDLYVARRDGSGWQVENLASVNTAADEQGSHYFKDPVTGTATLYFTSNRPGGLGGNDIYASTQLADESFGTPVLVMELSTPFNDVGAALRGDGLEVTLASNRPGTLGGLDIWLADRASTSEPWSEPWNPGPMVNSENFDGAPSLSFDGSALYFHSALRPGTVGQEGFFDLWVSRRGELNR
ncbi:MAG: hypothetical protein KY466_02895 [Gemmatimonadetes bacterium]|nr:hypothetical protein [Gemmatimonadota bacterium]